jgi:hypothetical protein
MTTAVYEKAINFTKAISISLDGGRTVSKKDRGAKYLMGTHTKMKLKRNLAQI